MSRHVRTLAGVCAKAVSALFTKDTTAYKTVLACVGCMLDGSVVVDGAWDAASAVGRLGRLARDDALYEECFGHPLGILDFVKSG